MQLLSKLILEAQKKPRGEGANTRRSRDGTGAKKGNEFHFGYKLHQKTDLDYNLIRDIETSTASLHDSRIDLPERVRLFSGIEDISV